MSKNKDAYDLATEIQKFWQTAAIGFNNASDIKKDWGEVPLVVKVNDQYLQVNIVSIDSEHGIILHVQQEKNMV